MEGKDGFGYMLLSANLCIPGIHWVTAQFKTLALSLGDSQPGTPIYAVALVYIEHNIHLGFVRHKLMEVKCFLAIKACEFITECNRLCISVGTYTLLQSRLQVSM